jgi:septal ring factor EnvC (AmiA/AmiB activator)
LKVRLLAAAFVYAALLVPSSMPGAAERASADTRREALRSRIERLRTELAETEEDRGEARDQLRDSERAISEANRSIRELRLRLAKARTGLATLASRRKKLELDSAARNDELGRLLIAIYEGGQPGFLKLLLSGEDIGQTARDVHYLGYISRAYAARVESLKADIAGLAALEREARESASEIAVLERDERASRDELLRQHATRRNVLNAIAGRVRAQRREVKMLQADDTRLARLVERIARVIAAPADNAPPTKAGDNPFAGLKGQLRLPVRGAVAHRFGSKRAEGGPASKGIFIAAPSGQDIRAVAPGVVVFAEWMRGYGNLLIVDHGSDYLTIYGNNESLLKGVGDHVDAAEVIATVGASGGGQETGLYFEARHEGKAFDPLTWISLR